MASTYTDIGTELMTTGENAGTWGTKTNTNIQILEEAIRGYVAQSIAGGVQTTALTYSDGSTGDSARNAVIALTGTITGNQTVTVTAKEKWWIIDNQTSGAYTVQVLVSGQTGVTWAATDKGTKILYCNGTDVIDSGIASNNFNPSSADGASLGSASAEFSDLYLADSGVIYFGNDQDVTLTHVADTALLLNSAMRMQFRDSGLYIGSNADGDLDIVSDGTAIDSINVESAGGITLDAGTASSGIAYEDDGTEMLRIYNSSSDVIIQNKVDAKDIVFKQYDGNEVARFADNRKMYFYDEGGEIISSDGTDFTFNSGNDINLTATTDINVPANVGMTFGDDAEKIEGDGTDLTITGNTINLTATTDVVLAANTGLVLDGSGDEKIESDGTDISISVGSSGDINVPANVGMTFGDDGEKIEGDGTDLTISASADLNLTATTDINIPANVGLTFGDDGEKIEGDGTDLTIAGNNVTIDAAADIVLDAAGNNLTFKSGGTAILDISNSSSDTVIQAKVDAKDIIFKQYDGNILLTVDDAGFVGIHNSAAGPGQLRLYEDTDNGSNYSAFQVGTQSGDITYTLPTADGSNGQVLKTNGSGTLSWGAAGTASDVAADDITAGDSAITLSTTSGDVTVDSNAGAAKVDGHTGVEITSTNSGNVTLDSATGIIDIQDGGSSVLSITEGNSGDVTIKLVTNAKDLVFTDNGDATNMKILDAAAGINVPGEVQTTGLAYTDGDDAITIADGGGVSFGSTLKVVDDKTLTFGTNDDWTIEYDENGDDDLVLTGSDISVESSTSAKPVFQILNTNADANGATLKFNKNGSSVADDDVIGNLDFVSEDDGGNVHTYGRIRGKIDDMTGGQEEGSLEFYVAEYDGTLTKGMDIVGLGSDGNITVDISTHDGSAGGLKLGGTLVTATAAELNYLDGVGTVAPKGFALAMALIFR